jgi:hypothetical protein
MEFMVRKAIEDTSGEPENTYDWDGITELKDAGFLNRFDGDQLFIFDDYDRMMVLIRPEELIGVTYEDGYLNGFR